MFPVVENAAVGQGLIKDDGTACRLEKKFMAVVSTVILPVVDIAHVDPDKVVPPVTPMIIPIGTGK